MDQMLEALTPSSIIIEAAKAAHELNRLYCLTLGDTSQLCWEAAPDWQHDSCVAGITQHFKNKCALTPEDSHNLWMEHKKDEGWKYGPVKNVETKEHPCLVSYADLPEEQRVKDRLFALVAMAFYFVYEKAIK